MRLAIRGRVDEQNPTAILMEDFLRGDKASQHFLLKCVGRDPIKIASATYDPKFLNVTWKTSPEDARYLYVEVTASPAIPFGAFEQQLKLVTNDANRPLKSISVTGYVMRPVEVSPNDVLFGVVQPGQSADRDIRIYSPYGYPISKINILADPANAVSWDGSSRTSADGTLATVRFRGRFDPGAAVSHGSLIICGWAGSEMVRRSVDFYAINGDAHVDPVRQ
jgi:hypothetical protein